MFTQQSKEEISIDIESIVNRHPYYNGLTEKHFTLTINNRKYLIEEQNPDYRHVFFGRLLDSNNPDSSQEVVIKITTMDDYVALRFASNLSEELSPVCKVAKFIEAGIYNDKVLLVSERLKGQTIYEYLLSSQRKDPKKNLKIMYDITSTLVILESNDLLYSDPSLANFIILDDSEKIGIFDFNICYLNQRYHESTELQDMRDRVFLGHLSTTKVKLQAVLSSLCGQSSLQLNLDDLDEELSEKFKQKPQQASQLADLRDIIQRRIKDLV
jgi:serine/threonine protein kinase